MIVRPDADSLLLITQPDHAALSAAIMSRWQADGFSEAPTRPTVLLATREHDNGWREIDAAPAVGLNGRPYDFMTLPDEMKQSIWPRAVSRLAATDAWAGALVAEHALTVLRGDRPGRGWDRFFQDMKQMRDGLIAHIDQGGPSARSRLLADYRFVYLGDLLSLIFCNGWTDPYEAHGYGIKLDGQTLRVVPDPFAGARVPLRVRTKRLPARSYVHDLDLMDAIANSPWVDVEGTAIGESV